MVTVLLICPVRPGDQNDELKYAMRSWETNLHLPTPLQLMTVGHKPSWLEPDWHYKGNDFDSAPLSVFANVKQGAGRAVDLGFEECVYMNDDFFCLDPVGAVLPVRRNCSLAQHLAQFPANAATWWPISLRLTASWLAEAGFLHPESYEVHRPLLASPAAMFETLSQWQGGMSGAVPQWRTMYGAVNKVDAYPVIDAKLGLKAPGIGTPWVSTSDQTWRRYQSWLRPRFQKPSRWERT